MSTILKGKTNSMVLPSPEFGDSIIPIAGLSRKKTINNTLYTYKTTTGRRRVLHTYRLRADQALAFMDFIRAEFANKITMQTYENETWKVYIVTEPVTIQNDLRLFSTATVEYEGYKV